MSKFNTIEEYNKDLIIRLKYIDLSDYFTYIYLSFCNIDK